MSKRTRGIDNEVVYSRESETKAPSNQNKKLAAFTLAEVLITLAIIGIVAALTIPTVVNNYQKKAYYTQFMKMYNTLTTAMNLSQAEFGTPDTWSYDENNPVETVKKYIYPYLKIQTLCEGTNCSFSHDYKYLNMITFASASDFPADGSMSILQDGGILNVTFDSDSNNGSIRGIQFGIDTNGAKNPNALGRDFFLLYYTKESNSGKWMFDFSEYTEPTYCDLEDEYGQYGLGCAHRLLTEGKMNY